MWRGAYSNGTKVTVPPIHYSWKRSHSDQVFLELDIDGSIPHEDSCADVASVVVQAFGHLFRQAGLHALCSAWHSCMAAADGGGWRRVSLHMRFPLLVFDRDWQETQEYLRVSEFIAQKAHSLPGWKPAWTVAYTNGKTTGVKFDFSTANPAQGSLRGPFSGKRTYATGSRNVSYVRVAKPINVPDRDDFIEKPYFSKPPHLYYAAWDDASNAMACREATPDQVTGLLGDAYGKRLYDFVALLIPSADGRVNLPDRIVQFVGGQGDDGRRREELGPGGGLSLEYQRFRTQQTVADRQQRLATHPRIRRATEEHETRKYKRFDLFAQDFKPLADICHEVQEAIFEDEEDMRERWRDAEERAAELNAEEATATGRPCRRFTASKCLEGSMEYVKTAKALRRNIAMLGGRKFLMRARDPEGNFYFEIFALSAENLAAQVTPVVTPLKDGRNAQPIPAVQAWLKGKLGAQLVPIPYDGFHTIPFARFPPGPGLPDNPDPSPPYVINQFSGFHGGNYKFPADHPYWAVEWKVAKMWPKELLRYLHLFWFCVADQDEAVMSDLLDWLTDLMRNPADSKGKAICCCGQQGEGKNASFNPLTKWVLGGRHCKVMHSTAAITGQFNNLASELLLAHFDEAHVDKEAGQTLKHMITETTVMVNQKYLLAVYVSIEVYLRV
jgi:hypothetical protein